MWNYYKSVVNVTFLESKWCKKSNMEYISFFVFLNTQNVFCTWCVQIYTPPKYTKAMLGWNKNMRDFWWEKCLVGEILGETQLPPPQKIKLTWIFFFFFILTIWVVNIYKKKLYNKGMSYIKSYTISNFYRSTFLLQPNINKGN